MRNCIIWAQFGTFQDCSQIDFKKCGLCFITYCFTLSGVEKIIVRFLVKPGLLFLLFHVAPIEQLTIYVFFVFQKVCFKKTYCDMMNEKGRKEFSLESYPYLPPKLQDQASIRDQVELSQKSHGRRSLVGSSPWGH